MAAGQMDKSGEGLTRAGKICGIISIVLAIIWIIINIVTGGAYRQAGLGGTAKAHRRALACCGALLAREAAAEIRLSPAPLFRGSISKQRC